MPDPAYTIDGAAETADALRRAGKDGKKAVRKAGKTVGDFVADRSKARTRSGGVAMQQAAIRGLRGKGTLKGGALVITNGVRVPFALAAFLGVKGRRGWYAHPKYDGGAQQFPDWVGQNWTAGGRGGPYFINDVIRRHGDDIVAIFTDEVERSFTDLGLTLDT